MISLTQKIFLGKNSAGRAPIFVFSLLVFFWTIFDSIVSYVTPLLIEENGFSKSMIGLIISSSSVAGIIFDLLACKLFPRANFRRLLLVMFALCFIYPLLLWQSTTIWLFLLAMAIWGVYYDLYNFGVFGFIGRYTKKTDHATSFGMVQTFRSLGGLLAPLIAGLAITGALFWGAFTLSWLFLGLAFIFFIILLSRLRHSQNQADDWSCVRRQKNLVAEFKLWKKLGKLMAPVLLVTFYLFFIEAFFWTLAPLYAETTSLGQFSGLFLAAYTLPALLVGWFIGSVTKRFGKKKTAISSLLVGGLVLSSFFLVTSPAYLIVLVLLASFFINLALPAINAAYADYISEAPQVEEEIKSLEDCFFNIGYVLGPLAAGLGADWLGFKGAFSVLGLTGALLAIILLLITPKSIVIKNKMLGV